MKGTIHQVCCARADDNGPDGNRYMLRPEVETEDQCAVFGIGPCMAVVADGLCGHVGQGCRTLEHDDPVSVPIRLCWLHWANHREGKEIWLYLYGRQSSAGTTASSVTNT
jgi:hypothetical protein